MTQMTVFNPGARPTHLTTNPIPPVASIDDLTAGVTASYPVLRIKGKVWAVSMNGATTPILMPGTAYPVPAMQLVLVKANRHVSKTFYRDGYTDGATEAPNCWSFDGVAPDSAVPQPVCQSCAACPNNQIGSRISESGSKVKACPDIKRVAVMDPKSGTTMLLRLPYTSMKSLAKFAGELSKQVPPVGYNEIVTELAFDMTKAHPEITFKPVRWLTEDESAAVAEALADPNIEAILGGSPGEFQPAEPAPSAITSALGPRPGAAAPAAEAAAEEDAGEEEAPPPPPPKARAAAKAAAAAPAQTPVVVNGGSLEDALAAALKA